MSTRLRAFLGGYRCAAGNLATTLALQSWLFCVLSLPWGIYKLSGRLECNVYGLRKRISPSSFSPSLPRSDAKGGPWRVLGFWCRHTHCKMRLTAVLALNRSLSYWMLDSQHPSLVLPAWPKEARLESKTSLVLVYLLRRTRHEANKSTR